MTTATITQTTLLDTALFYKNNCGFDVIPVDLVDKYPKGFPGWQKMDFTDEILTDYITNRGYVIGIRNIEGLDIDNKGNPPAEILYQKWRGLVQALVPGLVKKLTVETTQNGGFHVAWRCEVIKGNQKLATRFPTNAEKEKDPKTKETTLIETRGKGGLLVVAPSPGYELIQSSWASIATITPGERKTLLDCARALDIPKPKAQPKKGNGGDPGSGDRPGDHYNAQCVEEALNLLKAAGWVFVYRCQTGTEYWRRPGKDKGVSATWDYEGSKCLYVFSTNASPFEPETSYTPFAIYSILEKNGDYNAAARELGERFGLNGKDNGTAPAAETEAPELVFEALSVAELMQRPPKEWHVEGLIGKGDLGMIYGDPGSGKSLLAIDVAVAAALAKSVADQFETPRPLNIAYCAGEGVAGLSGRFTAAINKYRVKPSDVPIMIYTDVPQLYDTSVEKSVLTFVTELSSELFKQSKQLDLLIIDTLHAASVGADENHARDMGVVLQQMKYARDVLGCTVILVHHSNRAGTYRGSSALHGAMDTMLQTKTNGDSFGILECFKQKDGEKFNRLFFKITPEHVSQSVYLDWGEVTEFDNNLTAKAKATLAILDLLKEQSEGLNQTQIIKKLGQEVGRNTIIEALKDLEFRGELTAETGPMNSKVYQLRLDF